MEFSMSCLASPWREGDNADLLWESWWFLLVRIIEPAALLEFRPESLGSSCLVTITDNPDLPRFEVDLSTLDPVVNIILEDDLLPSSRSMFIF
jgi:hypothetical protein